MHRPSAPRRRFAVRRAEPADIPFLARIDAIAGSAGFDEPPAARMLAGTGTSTDAFNAAVYAADASNWGAVADFLVLESDGLPVAACAGYEPEAGRSDHRPLRLDRMETVASALGWNRATLDRMLAAYRKEWGAPDSPLLEPQAPWIVETVGVLPEARGIGAGRAVVEAALEEGRRRGHASAGIMVVLGNEPAHRLYESLGFRPLVTYHAALFDDAFPGFVKFRMPLVGGDGR